MKVSAFVALILFTVIACKKQSQTLRPVFQDISESVYASGFIKSEGQYQVTSLVSGSIEEVMVRSGDSVRVGQAMFRLKSDAADENTSIALLNARNALLSNNYQKIEDAKNQIAQLKKRLQLDSVQYVRQSNLWAQNIGTKADLDFKELQLSQSRTALESAMLQLSDLERQLKYNESLSAKNLRMSKINQSEYIVTSKIDGVVFSVLKEKGELASPQTVLAIAGSTKEFKIELSVDENDIVKVQKDQNVFLKMDSYQGQVFEARVASIDPIMDESTRTFKVIAIFTKAPSVLYPNLSVEANIIIAYKENAMTLPRSVVKGDSIVTLSDGTTKRVKLGLRDFRICEIIEGLKGDEEIMIPK